MKTLNIKRVKIGNIRYKHSGTTTICIIEWLNPVTLGVQKSKGVAKCTPTDMYNYAKGEHIAEARAKITMWKTYKESLAKAYLSASHKHNELICKEKRHIKQLINN